MPASFTFDLPSSPGCPARPCGIGNRCFLQLIDASKAKSADGSGILIGTITAVSQVNLTLWRYTVNVADTEMITVPANNELELFLSCIGAESEVLLQKLSVTAALAKASNDLAAITKAPVFPVWDTGASSGTLTGTDFSAVFSSQEGTIRLKGSRPITESLAQIFSFLNSAGQPIGPTILDGLGGLQVRIRDAASADLVVYNLPVRTVPEFDLVINWSTSASSDRHKVWSNGVLQTALYTSTAAYATTQNQLSWGATNLTVFHLAYFSTRQGSPSVLGSAGNLAAFPRTTLKTDTTTAHTLSLTDAKFVTDLTAASGCAITIPAFATTPFPAGFEAEFVRATGAGIPTASLAGGVTLRNSAALASVAVEKMFKLKSVGTNSWIVIV